MAPNYSYHIGNYNWSNQKITSIHKTVKLFQLDPSFRMNVLIAHFVSVSFACLFFLVFNLEWLIQPNSPESYE